MEDLKITKTAQGATASATPGQSTTENKPAQEQPLKKTTVRRFRPPFSDLRLAYPSVSDDAYFVLPDNYSNKYNLTRGDFSPLSLSDALDWSLQKRGRVDI